MSSIVINGDTSGSVTLSAPAVAGTVTVTLPSASGTMAVTGGSPSFTTITTTSDATINGLTVGKGGGAVSTNTVVGSGAMSATATGTSNSAFGLNALNAVTSGSNNSGFGGSVLGLNTSGSNNTAMGYQALITNTTAGNSTAVGYQAAYTNNAGSVTAVGQIALYANTTGAFNVAVGAASLTANTTGASNTAVGTDALKANVSGVQNAALGTAALYTTTITHNNTAIGYNALYNYNRTADVNGFSTALGSSAGSNLTTGQYVVLLGYNAQASSVSASNQIVIGANNVGQADNTVSIGYGGTNYIYATPTSSATWTKASDERIKKNIQDLDIGLDFINELKIKSYNWKPSNEIPESIIGYSEINTQDTTTTMYGMLAQDVKSAMDKYGYEHFAGWNVREADGLQGVANDMFVLPLINAVKELSAQVESMKAEIALLKGA